MTDDSLAASASGMGALADPARRALYRYVAGAGAPVSRDQAAAGVGLPRHTVKFHLDRLVEEGLLDVEYRRLTGRRGPGAGRPAKLYRRAERQIEVSLPERRRPPGPSSVPSASTPTPRAWSRPRAGWPRPTPNCSPLASST